MDCGDPSDSSVRQVCAVGFVLNYNAVLLYLRLMNWRSRSLGVGLG